MNKILFLISAVALVACSPGSILNQSGSVKKVGDESLAVGECMHFSGGFFGFGGDTPITVTQEDGTEVQNGTDLGVGDYMITTTTSDNDGSSVDSVAEATEACEKPEEGEEPAEAGTPEAGNEEPVISDGTPDDTPVGKKEPRDETSEDTDPPVGN